MEQQKIWPSTWRLSQEQASGRTQIATYDEEGLQQQCFS